MDDETRRYLSSVHEDLLKKTDRSSELDDLFQLTFLGDAETKQEASWCVAKMGQNKVQDTRILDILSSLVGDGDDQVRENVAWGIGEVAGAGIGDERSVDAVIRLMKDPKTDVRGMAVWAAGRLKHKLDLCDKEMNETIESLRNDESEYVRKAVDFALGRM